MAPQALIVFIISSNAIQIIQLSTEKTNNPTSSYANGGSNVTVAWKPVELQERVQLSSAALFLHHLHN
jgi:hypothetical protein